MANVRLLVLLLLILMIACYCVYLMIYFGLLALYIDIVGHARAFVGTLQDQLTTLL